MGQKYRFDPETQRSSHHEASPAQLRWLSQAGNDDRLPVANRIQVMRSCRDRGWARSLPEDPDYMLGYYEAEWFITPTGRLEVEHLQSRTRLAEEIGVHDGPRLSKLM